MKRRNLPFNALRAFEAAARHASVSAAAVELAVTHSAVSHQLKHLENLLDTRLFERTNRGLKITASGQLLLPVLTDCFDKIDATLDQLRQDDTAETIQVTSTPSFVSKWLLPRLGNWYAGDRATRIQLLPSLDNFDLGDNIDFAIRCGNPPWPDCVDELLMPIHLVPVCSPEQASSYRLDEPADALRYPLIHADIDGQPPGQEWRDWLQGCAVDCPEKLDGLSLKDPALAMQAAADGLGLAIGYIELIDRDLLDGRLICASKERIKHDLSYHLLYRESVLSNRANTEFRDWLIAQL